MTHEELVINPPFSWNNKNIGAFQALMLARVQISCILMCVIDIGLGVREPPFNIEYRDDKCIVSIGYFGNTKRLPNFRSSRQLYDVYHVETDKISIILNFEGHYKHSLGLFTATA